MGYLAKVEAHLWRVWVCYQLVLSAGIICLQLTRGAERGWRPGAGEQFTIHCKYCNVLPLEVLRENVKCWCYVVVSGVWLQFYFLPQSLFYLYKT